MKSKLWMTFGIPILLLFAIVLYFASPWLLIFIGIHLEPNPPRPEITSGEFPFRLVYEINGQQKVVQDTLICEFDGFGADEGRGKYRKWKQRLASGNERITLLKVDDSTEICFDPGSAEYYMGDLENYTKNVRGFPNALIFRKTGKFTEDGLVMADQLLKQYGIKLISWDYNQPINNTFSKSK